MRRGVLTPLTDRRASDAYNAHPYAARGNGVGADTANGAIRRERRGSAAGEARAGQRRVMADTAAGCVAVGGANRWVGVAAGRSKRSPASHSAVIAAVGNGRAKK